MRAGNTYPENHSADSLQRSEGFTLGANDLDSSARRISGTVKYLYNEAAMSGLEYRLVYDLNEGSYRALVHGTDGSVNEDMAQGREAHLKGNVRFLDVQLPGRGKFTEGQVTARILPTGWIDETIIHLSDSKNNVLTLKIVPLTGITEVFDGYREL